MFGVDPDQEGAGDQEKNADGNLTFGIAGAAGALVILGAEDLIDDFSFVVLDGAAELRGSVDFLLAIASGLGQVVEDASAFIQMGQHGAVGGALDEGLGVEVVDNELARFRARHRLSSGAWPALRRQP